MEATAAVVVSREELAVLHVVHGGSAFEIAKSLKPRHNLPTGEVARMLYGLQGLSLVEKVDFVNHSEWWLTDAGRNFMLTELPDQREAAGWKKTNCQGVNQARDVHDQDRDSR